MENLSLVAAIGRCNELGLNNHLIWKIKEDLRYYKKLTMHQNIIMGRKTFESMPSIALEGRNVFVLSSQELDKHYDINSFTNFDTLLEYIEVTKQNFVVVGGANIYKLFLPHIDTMYLTEIDEYSEADAYFPYIDDREWNIETIYKHDRDYKIDGDINYVRNRYVRRRTK